MEIEAGSTDEKIVNATLRILQKEGVSKTTTKKIASEAGVNEVTIFRNFKNKKNLIEVVKDYHLKLFIEKLENIFDFNGDEEIGEYLKKNFFGLASLSDDDFAIMKIAMEEVRDIPGRMNLIAKITDAMINKLDEFFKLQKEKGKIRDVNPRALAVMCFSITFESFTLSKIYYVDSDEETLQYSEDFLNILFDGINP